MSAAGRAPDLRAIRPAGTLAHIVAAALVGGGIRAGADIGCMHLGIGAEWPTLGVNIAGSMVGGWAFRWIHAFDAEGAPLHSTAKARVRERAIIGGFCGSLTTMSAVATMAASRTPESAALAMALHVGAGIASAVVGWWVGTLFPRRSPHWRR